MKFVVLLLGEGATWVGVRYIIRQELDWAWGLTWWGYMVGAVDDVIGVFGGYSMGKNLCYVPCKTDEIHRPDNTPPIKRYGGNKSSRLAVRN